MRVAVVKGLDPPVSGGFTGGNSTTCKAMLVIKTSDIITPAVADELAVVAHENYVAKAVQFLRDQFVRETRDVTDDVLQATVRLAYGHSQMRGLTKTRDHFKYLVPVMYWGSYFETDPQHRATLIRAEWTDENGAAIADADPAQIAIYIDAYLDETAADTNDLSGCMGAFEAHFTRNETHSDGPTCLNLMRATFPAHVARMADTDMREFVRMATTQGKACGLAGADLTAYVALALYFGTHFATDPLHDWAQAAYQVPHTSPDEQRLAIGKGLAKYLGRFQAREEDDDDV